LTRYLLNFFLQGGLDEALYNVIAMAREQEIPFVFALGRKALGRCVNKLVPVSVVGIFNYSGAEVSNSLSIWLKSTVMFFIVENYFSIESSTSDMFDNGFNLICFKF